MYFPRPLHLFFIRYYPVPGPTLVTSVLSSAPTVSSPPTCRSHHSRPFRAEMTCLAESHSQWWPLLLPRLLRSSQALVSCWRRRKLKTDSGTINGPGPVCLLLLSLITGQSHLPVWAKYVLIRFQIECRRCSWLLDSLRMHVI